jgi:hypothetical protein
MPNDPVCTCRIVYGGLPVKAELFRCPLCKAAPAMLKWIKAERSWSRTKASEAMDGSNTKALHADRLRAMDRLIAQAEGKS